MCFLIGVAVGGALIFVCPGLGTGGNAVFKYLKNLTKK